MIKNNKKIVAIVGPTASGKTGLAVFLAKKFNGEIVSADSRQVYRGLDIGTGKDLKEYGDVKYHLIDIIDPETPFTMFDWLGRARETIEDIFSRGKLPIVVGGTGLYVQALVEGFQLKKFQILNSKLQSSSKPQIPKYRREELDKMAISKLQKIAQKYLSSEANEANGLDLKNPRRLIRLIERAQSGEQMTKVKPDFEVLQIALDFPRDVLYQRVDKRVEDRFADGMLEEVEGLISAGVDPEWLIRLGLEYRIITEYICKNRAKHPQKYSTPLRQGSEGQAEKTQKKEERFVYSRDSYIRSSDFESMQQDLKYKIHAFARRQMTWFGRFPEIKWVKDKKEAEKIVKKFVV